MLDAVGLGDLRQRQFLTTHYAVFHVKILQSAVARQIIKRLYIINNYT